MHAMVHRKCTAAGFSMRSQLQSTVYMRKSCCCKCWGSVLTCAAGGQPGSGRPRSPGTWCSRPWTPRGGGSKGGRAPAPWPAVNSRQQAAISGEQAAGNLEQCTCGASIPQQISGAACNRQDTKSSALSAAAVHGTSASPAPNLPCTHLPINCNQTAGELQRSQLTASSSSSSAFTSTAMFLFLLWISVSRRAGRLRPGCSGNQERSRSLKLGGKLQIVVAGTPTCTMLLVQ